MPSEFGSVSLLFDMLVRDEGTVIGAGGNPFALRPTGRSSCGCWARARVTAPESSALPKIGQGWTKSSLTFSRSAPHGRRCRARQRRASGVRRR